MVLRYNLNALSFFLLLTYLQVKFFLPGMDRLVVGVGFLFALFSFLLGKLKLAFNGRQVFFLACLLLMCTLSLMLLFFGEKSDIGERNIFLNSLVQLVLILLMFSMMRNQEGTKNIVLTMCLMLALESVIIVGQFLYLSYGVGIEPRINEYFTAGMIEGSKGNPNNVAVLISLLTLSITAYFSMHRRYLEAYVCLFLSLLLVWLTLSRTVLVIWVLNFFAVFVVANYYGGIKGRFLSSRAAGFFVLLISFLTLVSFYFYFDGSSDVWSRSIERAMSLFSSDGDESVSFRYVAHLRLIENLADLGFGTFSDFNYSRFFELDDPWLMTVNPHSYIVEYSFLFGYPGFFLIAAIMIFLMLMLSLNDHLNIPFKMLACFSLLLTQAVPSTLVGDSYYFVPFVFLWLLKRGEKSSST